MSPLHWAADRGELEVAQTLVAILQRKPAAEAAAVLNARDASGDTALHYAVNTDNLELARRGWGCWGGRPWHIVVGARSWKL